MKTQLIKANGSRQINLFYDLMLEFNSKTLLSRGAKHTPVQDRYIKEMKICGIIDETINGRGDDKDIVFEVALSHYYAGFIQWMLDNQEARSRDMIQKFSRELGA